eukprot:13369301-Alexandrium_andersonii.AAC.1
MTECLREPYDPRKCKIASGVRNLNCAVPRETSNSTPEGLVRGGSASALSPMVAMKRAGRRAGGASRG